MDASDSDLFPMFCGSCRDACHTYRGIGVCIKAEIYAGTPTWFFPSALRYGSTLQNVAMRLVKIVNDFVRALRIGGAQRKIVRLGNSAKKYDANFRRWSKNAHNSRIGWPGSVDLFFNHLCFLGKWSAWQGVFFAKTHRLYIRRCLACGMPVVHYSTFDRPKVAGKKLCPPPLLVLEGECEHPVYDDGETCCGCPVYKMTEVVCLDNTPISRYAVMYDYWAKKYAFFWPWLGTPDTYGLLGSGGGSPSQT